MKKIKFIHTSDLHLDTPFRSLSSFNKELAGRLKDATVKSFEKIVDLAITEQVDFLLVSGDIFDGESSSLAAQLKFIKGLQGLSDKGINTYFICGNHDPLDSWMEQLALPEKVFRFGSSKVENVVFSKNGQPLAGIYGISYRTSRENRDMAGKYKIKAPPLPFSIALLHGTVGNPGPHANYAPFRLEDIADKGFDYWALGHIHKRQIIRKKDPAVVYPGNPQGRDFGETGNRGCFLVEIAENSKPAIQFKSTQQIRFEQVEVDLSGTETINVLAGLLEKAKTNIPDYDENASYILRFVLKGRTSLHNILNNPGEMEALRDDLNEGQLNEEYFTWIDNISVETQPDIDVDKILKGNDFPAEVLKLLEQNQTEEFFREIEKEITLPVFAKNLIKADADDKKRITEKVKWMLLDQLVKND